MTTTTVDLHVAARATSPRGHTLSERSARLLRAVGCALLKAAERQGAQRASQELRHLARGFACSQPHLAVELQAAAERCEALLREAR